MFRSIFTFCRVSRRRFPEIAADTAKPLKSQSETGLSFSPFEKKLPCLIDTANTTVAAVSAESGLDRNLDESHITSKVTFFTKPPKYSVD